MKIYGNLRKSIKINEINEHLWDISVLKIEHGCILYSKQISASHICLPKKNRLFKQRQSKNRDILRTQDFDL